jgi:hypothetical protein
MDYIVSSVKPGQMVTSLGRPRPRRSSQQLRGEVVQVTREGRDSDGNAGQGRRDAFSNMFGYAGARAFDEQAIVSLKVRTNQNLSDLVGKRVIVTIAE